MRRKRWLVVLLAIVGIGALAPSYVRAYRVAGSSDAPSFLVGDRILVFKGAYDLRLPYTDVVLFARSQPRAGQVVMFRPPGQEDVLVFKRVIGCPGDDVVMRDSHVEINGVSLHYQRLDERAYADVAVENRLGAIVERESGNGPAHAITHTPGAGLQASFGPVRVPEDHYFVIGDNRDNSLDSRAYGPVPRRSIVGRVVHVWTKRGR